MAVGTALLIAVLFTVFGGLYLLTIGRLTDVIPILGFADDVLVILAIVLSWLNVLVTLILSNPLFWLLGLVVLLVLAFKAIGVKRLFGKRRKR